MPIYKPTELLQFLNELGIRPRKGLSQNFLIDGNIIRKIAQIGAIEPGDLVLEIGPGPGSLTEELLSQGANLVVVEKDAILSKALERLKNPTNHLEIFCQDILEFPVAEVIKAKLPKGKKAKVIANLPYHLTTPILAKLVTMSELFSTLTIMVQEEVARRMTSSPGTKEFGSLTLFLDYYSTPQYAFTVSKNCFFPIPKVQSAIVQLELHPPPPVSDEAKFFLLTRSAFEHKRKMLRASLRDLYFPEAVEQGLTQIGCNPQARPEQLSLDQFIQLFELLEHAQT